MKRMKLLVFVIAALAAVGFGTGAWAFFTSHGSSTASGRVGSLNAPTGVSAGPVSATSVSVNWTASISSGGAVAPQGYYVTRTNISTQVTSAACGTSSLALTTSVSCTDNSVTPGTYQYAVIAVYQSWTASANATTTVTVLKSTTSAVNSSSNPSVSGQSVTFTDTVTGSGGTPTGTATFEVTDKNNVTYTCQGGNNTLTLSGGAVGCTLVASQLLVADSPYTIIAVYSGDSNFYGSTSSAFSQTVSLASPTLSVSAPATDTAGTAITAANITATLAASSGSNDANVITFKVFGPQTTAPTSCTTGGTTVGTATPAGNNTYPASAGFTPSAAGTYWWFVSSGADSNNNAASSLCNSGSMTKTTVSLASPTLSVSAPATDTAGTAITAANITATLAASSGSNDANVITFKVFGPQTTAPTSCTTGGTTVGTATPAGNNTYPASAGFTPSAAGTYWWFVSSGADSNNNAASSLCNSGSMTKTTVSLASPTLSVSAPATDTAGTAITAANITATLAASSGSNDANVITFKVFGPQTTAPTSCTTGGTTVGTATPAGNNTYPASAGFTPSAAGTYWWFVSSGADSNNNAASSLCNSGSMTKTTVSLASPTLSVSAPATDTAGTAITAANITATLAASSGSNDANVITFKVFGPLTTAPTSCTTGGTTVGTATPAGNNTYPASAGFTPSAAGTYWWFVSSGADSNNNAASSLCNSGSMTKTTVSLASPTLSVSAPATDTAGTAITAANITATLAASSGSNDANVITFKVFGPQTTAPTSCTTGGTTVGTATPAGNNTYPASAGFTPSAAGTYWWFVSSGADSNNNAASSLCNSGSMTKTTVSLASPTLSVSAPATDTAGTAITAANITATLAASSGSNDANVITFKVFGPQTTAPTSCTTGGTTVGTATPAGNNTYPASAGFTPSAAGTYWWFVSSGADSNNNAASSLCNSGSMTKTTVSLASPTLSVSAPATDTAGTAITAANITATLAASSGSNDANVITFKVFGPQTTAPTSCTTGGTTVGTATPAGNNTYPASAGFTPSAAGTYWWFVSSGADSNNNAASSLCNSGSMTKTTVSLASPTLTTTLSANSITAGGTAYDTSTLSGGTASAGGTVTYSYWSNNTCTIGQVVVGSAVTVTSGVVPNSSAATFNSAGTYYWQAVYSGDANNNGTSSTCTAITNEQLTVTSPATASVLVQGTSSPTTNITASSASTQLIAVYVHGNSGSPSASVATGSGTPFATESTIFTQGIVTSGSTKEYLVLIEATGRDVSTPRDGDHQ